MTSDVLLPLVVTSSVFNSCLVIVDPHDDFRNIFCLAVIDPHDVIRIIACRGVVDPHDVLMTSSAS